MGVLRSVGMAIVIFAISGAENVPAAAPDSTPATTSDAEPLLEVLPEFTDFDRVDVGDIEGRMVRIVNLGNNTVRLGDVEVVGDGFSLAIDNCSGRDIEPDDSCALTVLFKPPAGGNFGGRVQLNEPTTIAGDLSGIGVEAPPTMVTEPPDTTNIPASSIVVTEPPTTTPPTVPNSGDTLEERLAECEAAAAKSQVQYAPALQMVVGEITDVDAVAAIGANEIPPSSDSGPPVTEVPAVLHCEVEATLRGQGFEIDPADAQPGSFIDHPVIAWTWQVTPTSAGPRTLQFRILPVAREGDLRLPGTPVPFEATITVVAAPRSFIDRVDGAVRGVVGYPLVTGFGTLAGIAAALAACWRWILKRPWPWKKSSRKRRRPPRRRPR